jgi:hypothetical protein
MEAMVFKLISSASNVLSLLKLAHLYECQSLLDRCEKHLMNCIEIPLLELLTCADLYGLNKLVAESGENMPVVVLVSSRVRAH